MSSPITMYFLSTIIAFGSLILYQSIRLSGDAGIRRLIERNPKYRAFLDRWENRWYYLIQTSRVIVTLSFSFFFWTILSTAQNLLSTNFGLPFLLLIVFSIIIWMLAESISAHFADRISLSCASTIALLAIILRPFLYPLQHIEDLFNRIFSQRSDRADRPSTEDEVINLIDENGDKDLDLEERDMIRSVFEFGDSVVREVMTPRVDIVGLSDTLTIEETLDYVKESTHSRFPVYHESMDEVMGMIHIRDLLRAAPDMLNQQIGTLCKKIPIVPETMPLNDVLQLMKKRRTQLVVVVDEYGGTAGLVTMEDVIEELVGEIEDEFDPDEQDFIKRSDGSYWIRGKMPIYDLNEQLEFPLPESDEYDSIGGLVCSELGYIPVAGELFTLSTYEVKVQSSNQRQVLIVQLKPINMADNEIPSTS
ncbi:MAG: hypothetical protein CBE26_04830 [Kiritimatiellaceae bacterium TMED266]|nr:MAG: hypothetical protein CBE26_04830 [Kiritimatiellaceae bacterium TMED266]